MNRERIEQIAREERKRSKAFAGGGWGNVDLVAVCTAERAVAEWQEENEELVCGECGVSKANLAEITAAHDIAGQHVTIIEPEIYAPCGEWISRFEYERREREREGKG